MATAETLPQLLLENARRFPQKVALREKRFGIWQTITWSEVGRRVKDFSLGLAAMGLEKGQNIAIIGDNRPEWIIAELSAQVLGCASIGVYQDAVVEEVRYIVTNADVRFLVVEDQEQVDKVIELWDALRETVQSIIYYDPRGLRNYAVDELISFPAVETIGREFAEQNPTHFEESISAGRGEDIAIVSTTSGTTSRPKLACITHANLIAMAEGLTAVDAFQAHHEFVSFLPLSWIGEQMISVSCGLYVGFALNFPEEPETTAQDIREIGPHIMFAPPRIWENMVSNVQVKMEDSGWLKRRLFALALAWGTQIADAKFQGESLTLWQSMRERLAQVLVFSNLLDQLGLRRIRWAYTGGAALGPDVFRFFHALGINLKQGYGQTETTGICVIHRDGDIKFQTVGLPVPGAEVSIASDGEILAKGTMCFRQYYRDPVATRNTLLDEGWVKTGDAGYFDDDGHLIVIDRVSDVMQLHDGTTFSPQFIENKLKFSQYIREAVVFGGDFPFVTAMINIDFGNVGKWAENHHLSYTTYTDLAQKQEVYEIIRGAVEQTNDDLPPAARIRRFLLLHKELDADDAELTRTRKVRRGFIHDRYGELIDALYGNEDSIQILTDITYQDGSKAKLEIALRIEDLTPAEAELVPE
ncbi:MAG: AMP-binding protein [Chloroflexi bacterium]|nr:AMP-binding protein [Chloroflexota bacterium]